MNSNKFINFLEFVAFLPFLLFFFIYEDIHERIIKIPFIKRRRDKKMEEEKREYEEWKRQDKINRYKGKTEIWNGYKMTSFFYDGELPFDMYDHKVFVYIENDYNEKINNFILQHWEEINNEFDSYECQFLYVPKWNFETSMLHLANLGEEQTKRVRESLNNMTTVQFSMVLMKTLGFENEIGNEYGGIFHFAHRFKYGDGYTWDMDVDKSKFTYCSMLDLDEEGLKFFFHTYLRGIAMQRKAPHGFNKTIRVEDWLKISKKNNSHEIADTDFPIKMKEIAENVKKEIETLKKAGYYEMLLHTLGEDLVNELKSVQTVPALSHLEITDDYRIILTDYGKEVKMTPIQKALYIFYLRHPEGIEFKVLSAYYDEMLSIYKVLSNRENIEKQRESVRRLVDVTDNAINEKCSRIKEAFLRVADDFISRNYYIVAQNTPLKRNGITTFLRLKKISLPRELVTYPKEISNIEISNPVDKITQIEKMQTDEQESLDRLKKYINEENSSKMEAIQRITEHINLFPKSYIAYYLRAILYGECGRYKEAVADNQVLIDYDEVLWSNALNNQAEEYCLLGEYEKALEVINHYFDIEKDPMPEAYCTKGEIYEQMGMMKEAEEYMALYEKYKREE